mgnify:CR=1 FL=1
MEGKRLSVLKELYYGNINPHEKRVISNLEFEKHEKLSKTLKNEEKYFFEQLLAAHEEVSSLELLEYFIEEWKLGSRFMLDTFII